MINFSILKHIYFSKTNNISNDKINFNKHILSSQVVLFNKYLNNLNITINKKILKLNIILISSKYSTKLNTLFTNKYSSTKSKINYSNTSLLKYINTDTFNNFIILFLRKFKIFNKGRYSRNRQFYRTGYYWCVYLSLILYCGLHYWFYHYVLNFGYL